MTKNNIIIKKNYKVFSPNLTTRLLIDAIFKFKIKKKNDFLDLGCGSGIIGLTIKKHFKNKINLFLSDISNDAIKVAKKNSELNNINCEIKISDYFKNWKNYKFDIIVNDISAISEEIAKKSKWYNKYIPHKCGKDGLRNSKKIIKDSINYLKKNGFFIFPVISLSDEDKILDFAKIYYKNIKVISCKEWPLPKELSKIQNINKKFYVEKFGIKICSTKIILATNHI